MAPILKTEKAEEYKCYNCGKIFATKSILIMHTRKHPDGTKNHVCKICGKSFFDPSARNNHEKFTHGNGFKCKQCEKIFKYPRALKLHMIEHDTGKPEYTKELREKAQHLVTDLGIAETAKLLKIPYSRVLDWTTPKRFMCNLCGKYMRSQSKLTIHMRREQERPNMSQERKILSKDFVETVTTFAKEHSRKAAVDRYNLDTNTAGKIFRIRRKGAQLIEHVSKKQEIKEKALELAKNLGIKETAKQLKIPYSRVWDWTTKGKFMCTLCKKYFRSQQKLDVHMRAKRLYRRKSLNENNEQINNKILEDSEAHLKVQKVNDNDSGDLKIEEENVDDPKTGNEISDSQLLEESEKQRASDSKHSTPEINNDLKKEKTMQTDAFVKIIDEMNESILEASNTETNSNEASETDNLSIKEETDNFTEDKIYNEKEIFKKEEDLKLDEEDVDDPNEIHDIEIKENCSIENGMEKVEAGNANSDEDINDEIQVSLGSEKIKAENCNIQLQIHSKNKNEEVVEYEIIPEEAIDNIINLKEKETKNKLKTFKRMPEDQINFNIDFQFYGINKSSDKFIISSKHIEDENFMQVIHSKKYKSKPKSYECNICNKLCTCLFNLKIHLKSHSVIANHNCEFCTMKFKFKTSLVRHIKSMHSSLESKLFKCQYCFKDFTTKHNLLGHENLHKNELNGNSKPFICEACNKCFTTKYGLAEHEKNIHTSSKEASYLCNLCAKAFKNQKYLRQHTSWHKGVQYKSKRNRNFSCDQCTKVYKDKKALVLHQQIIHLGELSNFLCTFCKRTFTREANFKAHQKLHTGIKL